MTDARPKAAVGKEPSDPKIAVLVLRPGKEQFRSRPSGST